MKWAAALCSVCPVARIRGLEIITFVTWGLRPRLYARACSRRLTFGKLLFLELCVSVKIHRLVLEIPEQLELVHEVWIEREAGRQYQPQKPALAESKNTLARDPRPAEHHDLPVGGAI